MPEVVGLCRRGIFSCCHAAVFLPWCHRGWFWWPHSFGMVDFGGCGVTKVGFGGCGFVYCWVVATASLRAMHKKIQI